MFNRNRLKRISNIFFYTDERVKCLVKTLKKSIIINHLLKLISNEYWSVELKFALRTRLSIDTAAHQLKMNWWAIFYSCRTCKLRLPKDSPFGQIESDKKICVSKVLHASTFSVHFR